MYLTLTEHYKGRLPVDIGGLTLGAYVPKECTPDSFAKKLAEQNYPNVVPCTKEGKYLVKVPPVPVEAPVVEAPPEVPQEAPVEPPPEAIRSDANSEEVPPEVVVDPPETDEPEPPTAKQTKDKKKGK